MASGRRDYTWGFLSEAATEGRYSESFFARFTGNVAADEEKEVYSYEVPEGYRLGINRIIFTTPSRVVNFFMLLVDAAVKTDVYFSDNHCLNISDQNPLYVAAGSTVSIRFLNSDVGAKDFLGTVIGVLEQLIS